MGPLVLGCVGALALGCEASRDGAGSSTGGMSGAAGAASPTTGGSETAAGGRSSTVETGGASTASGSTSSGRAGTGAGGSGGSLVPSSGGTTASGGASHAGMGPTSGGTQTTATGGQVLTGGQAGSTGNPGGTAGAGVATGGAVALGGASAGTAGTGSGGTGGGVGGHCVEEGVEEACIGLGFTQRLFCPALTTPPWGCELESTEDAGSHYCCAPHQDTVMEAARCDEILLGDAAALADYPPAYVPPENAQELYQAAKTAFIDAHQIPSDYGFSPSGLTYSLEVRKAGDDQSWTIGEDANDEAHTVPEIEAVLASAPSLFHYEGIRVNEDRTECGLGTHCRYEFFQDYCGLFIESKEADYRGTFRVDLDSGTPFVQLIYANLVPMVPIYRNPVLTAQQIIDQVVGSTVSWECADGTHEAQVSADTEFTIEPAPLIYTRLQPDDETRLEYRLVADVSFFISPGNFTAYVDVIDGTLMGPFSRFFCD